MAMIKFINLILQKIRGVLAFTKDEFLCDSCKYDYSNACHNSNKPNVKDCGEYKKRI